MRLEINSAVEFLVQLLRFRVGQLSEIQLQAFKTSLTELLRYRYRDHWFPDEPNRGSGYRCIRINGKMDPVIAQAGIEVGLQPKLLHRLFPRELTMWIDPAEVSYRIGENGSICVLFESPAEPPQPVQQLQQYPQANDFTNQHHQQFQHQHYHHHQQQQCFEQTCKDSLIMEHVSFNEQIAAYVSS